jgi:hypothetical protein
MPHASRLPASRYAYKYLNKVLQYLAQAPEMRRSGVAGLLLVITNITNCTLS